MKKALILLLSIGAVLGVAWASTIVYNGYLANEHVGYAKTFALDLKTDGEGGAVVDTLAATADVSSSTIPSVTFNNGRVSTGSFTVASLTDITGATATDYITVVSTTGLRNSYITINGKQLRNGYEWNTGATTAATASNIASVLTLVSGIDASAGANVVYATATAKGTASNAFTLTSSTPAALTVNAATFAGGKDNAVISVNGVALTQGVSWNVAGTAGDTAEAITVAINANASLSPLVTATRGTATVTITSKAVGVNAFALASNFSGITKTGTAMTGGAVSAYTINTPTITANHTMSTGTPVVYTTGSAVGIGGLTYGATYYAIAPNTSTFQLSATSTGAVAGTYITLTSSSTAGPHNFTVAPVATSGTWGLKWQVSNDNSTWADMPLVSVSSISFPSPYTPSTTAWNLSNVNHRYIRLLTVKGTNGSINLKVAVTGRREE
jgi:hypothetical protein